MAIRLSDEDRAIQDTARRFVDTELIPWEVHAETNDGIIPAEVAARHERTARGAGPHGHQPAGRARGLRPHDRPTGPRAGAGGPGNQRSRLGRQHAGRVAAERRLGIPDGALCASHNRRGEHECCAITEEGAGSDVDAITATARATETTTCSAARSGTSRLDCVRAGVSSGLSPRFHRQRRASSDRASAGVQTRFREPP